MAKKVEEKPDLPVEKQSVILTKRINETQARLEAIEAELSGIDAGFDVEAEAENLDSQAINALQGRRNAALTEKDLMGRRLVSLREQLVEAERTEDLQRLAQIEAEQASKAEEAQTACQDFKATLSDLLEEIGRLHGIFAKLSELRAEASYLHELHGVPRSSLPPLMPDVRRDLLAPVEHALAALSGAGSAGSQWRHKTQELKAARAAEARKNQEPRPILTVKPVASVVPVDNSGGNREPMRRVDPFVRSYEPFPVRV